MRFTAAASLVAAGLSASANAQGYQCPIMPIAGEKVALDYAYAIQNLLVTFYARFDFTAEYFSSYNNSMVVEENGETLGANLATNMAGLKKQATLGMDALNMLGGAVGNYNPPLTCDYSYPDMSNATAVVQSSQFLEATLCGAFIGLGDYVQAPPAAFLMARLAAEHGIHGSYLLAYIGATHFSADSTSLTPAFTPDTILMDGEMPGQVGYLGRYIPDGCAPMPEPPCGGEVTIGPLLAMLTSGNSSMGSGGAMSSSSSMGMGSAAGANATMGAAPATYTGGAPRVEAVGMASAAVLGAGAVAAVLLS